MLLDYVLGGKHLFAAGGRENRNNNIGEAFWRGYSDERYIWDTDAPLFIAFRAGQAIAKPEARLEL